LKQEHAIMTEPFNPILMSDLDRPPDLLSKSQGAFPVWSKVYTQPSERTFLEIISHPEARAKSAYIWVFLAGTFSAIVNSMVQMIVVGQAAPALGQYPMLSTVMKFGGILGVVCGAPIAGLFSVIGFAVSVGIVQLTAKFFGGQGSFDRLAYAFGAITVPFTLISALLLPLNAIPFVSFGTLPVMVLLALYVFYLQLAAVKAVHACNWGEAAAILILPAILIVMLCGASFLFTMKAASPQLMDLLQQIQQNR
jgi:hypothetical protein